VISRCTSIALAGSWLLAAFALLLVLVAARLLVGTDGVVSAMVQLDQDCRFIRFSNVTNLLFSSEGCVILCALSSLFLLRAGYGLWSLVPWLVFGTVPIEVAAKIWVLQPGPSGLAWPEAAGCRFVEPPVAVQFANSFPSGHMARAAYFAVLIVGLARRSPRLPGRALTFVLTLVVVAVAIERVYRGVHWPSDVIGGLLLGSALAVFAVQLLTLRRPRRYSQTSCG
jgi:membrane-associated phospholipid phosphatase